MLLVPDTEPGDSPTEATSRQRAVQRPVAPRVASMVMGPSVVLDVDLILMMWMLYLLMLI